MKTNILRVGRASYRADASKPTGAAAAPWYRVQAYDDTGTGPVEVAIYSTIGRDWWSGEGVEAASFIRDFEAIPKARQVLLRINSPGGSVNDGILIYNRLCEHRARITVRVDSLAASIASVVAMCGSKLEMPSSARLMIHDPWAMVEGNADELRRAAEMLDKHRDSMMAIYLANCRDEDMTEAKMKRIMAAETWFTAQEAVDGGFATDLASEPAVFQACFDLSRFRRAPEGLSKRGQSTDNERQTTMNKRKKLMAALDKLGVAYDKDATAEALTDEALETMLATAQAEAKAKAKEREEAASSESSEEPTTTAKTKVKPIAAVQDPEIADLRAKVGALTAAREQDRKAMVQAAVEQCVAEDRIPAPQMEKWVARAMADPTVLDDLRAMQPKPPGSTPLAAVITGESPKDIERGILRLRDPLASWQRGGDVSMLTISAMAKRMATEIAANRKKLEVVLATNTVDSTLKRNVILNDLMRAFKRRLVFLGVFSVAYKNVPLQGTNKVTIPFYELDTTTSQDFLNSTGYTFTQNSDTGAREITINKRKFKSMEFSSDEFRRQPYFRPEINMQMKAEQLALDVWLDVLSGVTQATFGAAALEVEPGNIDVDDIITLRQAAQDADWPDIGRALVLGTAHEAALLSDETLKHFLNSNSDMPLRDGATGRLLGFESFYSPRIPTNGEDLGGFICMPQAMLVATSPVAPAPGVRNQLLSYDLVVDPDTGIAFEYRYWGEAQADKDREVVECNYGYRSGNASALKRINMAASTHSSSSSQSSSSSVNSSSSSSSQT